MGKSNRNKKKYEKPRVFKEKVFDNISLQACGKTAAIRTQQCRRFPKAS